MPDDIGHFRVILDAEVDRDIGKSLEEGFEKSSEKIGRNLQKEIEESIDKSIEKAKKFEKSFKIPSFGQIGEKLTGFLGESTKKITAGGLASAAGEGSGSDIMAIVSKLSIVVGILALVYDVIKSLAPIVAIFKLISAMLQLTLYPIAQMLLNIFKPILALILRMFIIPWYTTWGPLLEKFFGVGDNKILNDGPIAWFTKKWNELLNSFWSIWNGFWGSLIDGFWSTWNGFWGLLIDGFWSLWTGFWNTLESTWTTIWNSLTKLILNGLQKTLNWLSDNWSGITNAILGPLKDVWDWINSIQLPSWLGGGGRGNDRNKSPDLPSPPWEPGWNTPTPPSTNPNPPESWWPKPYLPFATGGIVNTPTVALIGERGPEAVIPLNKLNGMSNINLTINIAKVEKSVDINDIINRIERTLYTNMKRAGAR